MYRSASCNLYSIGDEIETVRAMILRKGCHLEESKNLNEVEGYTVLAAILREGFSYFLDGEYTTRNFGTYHTGTCTLQNITRKGRSGNPFLRALRSPSPTGVDGENMLGSWV